MKTVIFLCHGNICRSAAAEFVFKKLVKEEGRESEFHIYSRGVSNEEYGNDIYPPMKRALEAAGYVCERHAARQTTRADYAQWDYLIGMDEENRWDMHRIYGGDPEGKISLLMDWAGFPGREIDDPWYTRDFSGVLKQIEAGCAGLLEKLPPKA